MHANKKPKIRNVVCTADLKQNVNVPKLSKLSCGIYDQAIYGGRCGYVKTPDMEGKVTIFPSGKMISVGAKSTTNAVKQLNHAKFLLVQEKLISDIKLKPNIRNIVATIDVGHIIPIDKLSLSISGSIYEPETFPALIVKGLDSCSFLVFASGKIVIVGAKSVKETNTSSFELLQKLNSFMKHEKD